MVQPLAASTATRLCASYPRRTHRTVTLCVYSRRFQARTAAGAKLSQNLSKTLAVPTVQTDGTADWFCHDFVMIEIACKWLITAL